MTRPQPAVARSEEGGAIAVEWITSIAAAIGLCLCLVVIADDWTPAPMDQGVERMR